MLVGDKIKDHLVSILDTHQPGKSSHWQEQLQRFSYSEDTGISGLIGLGSTSRGGLFGERYIGFCRSLLECRRAIIAGSIN